MRIIEVDRYDEPLTRRFWEVGKAADEAGRPWSSYWSWPAARTAFTADPVASEKVLLAAFSDDLMVGTAEVSLPLLDNTHQATLEVYVDPAYQRRGAGALLVEAAERTARERGRTTVTCEVACPLGAESPGYRLARRAGYVSAVVDDMKVVDLPATEATWPALLAGTEAPAAGYALHTWHDVCPDAYVDGYCALIGSFNEESPIGALDVEPEHWDEARLRDKEARFRRGGRHETVTVALAPDGGVAGVSEVMVSEHAADRGFQGATLVAPAHRGHRLGLRLKLVNQQAVRDRFPRCRTLLTGNADVNRHMNEINATLGYRTVEQVHEMQHEVGQ